MTKPPMQTGFATLWNTVTSTWFSHTDVNKNGKAARRAESNDAVGIAGWWNNRSAGFARTADSSFDTNATFIWSKVSSRSRAVRSCLSGFETTSTHHWPCRLSRSTGPICVSAVKYLRGPEDCSNHPGFNSLGLSRDVSWPDLM